MKVSVILNEEEAFRFADFCTKKGYKKSTLIARLIREHMNKENFNMQTPLPFSSENKNG